MRAHLVLVLVLAACGSAGPTAKPPAPAPPPAKPVAVIDERAKHDEIAAAHRKLESEQQDALAATCEDPKPQDAHERCLPSCYATEPADPRAGKKLAGTVELVHLACSSSDSGPFVIADELEGARLAARTVRGRVPRGHGKGTWQATVEQALAEAQHVARGDTIVVTGTWRERVHPLTSERLRCVTVAQYVKTHHPIDACGGDGALACEANGNAAARGLNVIHYRLAEARRLQAAGKPTECQQAALEAIAVARGMPRWRQYAKLNVAAWTVHAGYRTRFDGTLDEDALFAAAASLGAEAEAVHAACGGPAGASTTARDEQSFHTCW